MHKFIIVKLQKIFCKFYRIGSSLKMSANLRFQDSHSHGQCYRHLWMENENENFKYYKMLKFNVKSYSIRTNTK